MRVRTSCLAPLTVRALLLFAAAASLRCGTGLFFVQAEDSELCKTVPGVSFPGTVLPAPSQTFHQSFDYDYASVVGSFSGQKVTTQIKLNRVTFTAKTGVSDLNFIDAAAISLGGVADADGGTLPEKQVLTYTKTSNPGPQLVIPGGDFIDVTAYLQGGKIHVNTAVTGVMPLLDWSMDIQVCLDVKAHDNYL